MNQSNENEDFMHKMREALNGIKASEKKFKKLNDDFRNELVKNFGLSETTITSNDLIMEMVNFKKITLGDFMKMNKEFHKENNHYQEQILHSQEAMLAAIRIKGILKSQNDNNFHKKLLTEIQILSENTSLFHQELSEILTEKIFDQNTLNDLESTCDSILVYLNYSSARHMNKTTESLENFTKSLKKTIGDNIASN